MAAPRWTLKVPQGQATVEPLSIYELKAKIRKLKALPNDFRDLAPYSKDWLAYHELVPQQRETMQLWLHGPVVVFGVEPTAMEKYILGNDREYTVQPKYVRTEKDNCGSYGFEWLVERLRYWDSNGYCLAYMPLHPLGIVESINKLLSFFGWNIRAKALLTDDKGHRLREGL